MDRVLWIKMHDIQIKLGVKNTSDLTRKATKDIYDTQNLTKEKYKKYKRYEKEFIPDLTGIYIHEDLDLTIIMDCRSPIATAFRPKLAFKQHDLIMTKEQSVLTKIMKVFASEKMLLQHFGLSFKINLYFPKHKLAIEVDEKGHKDKNIDYKIQRQKTIEK